MAVSFDDARRSVLDESPEYEIAEYGFEGDDHWLLILLPETMGGRIAAVAKVTGEITWINENAAIYEQDRPVGSSALRANPE